MVRRYAIPCIGIMIISVVASAIAYKKQKPNDFAASCSIQIQIPLNKDQPRNVESLNFNNRIAAHEITLALSSGALAAVAKAQKVDETEVIGRTTTAPLFGLGTFSVTLLSVDNKKAVQLVNAVCDELVTRVKKQRSDEVSSEIKAIQDRLKPIEDSLAKIERLPAKKRSSSDRVQLLVQTRALVSNTVLIANLMSLPPDTIGVLQHGIKATPNDRRSKVKDGGIGVAVGGTVCFLLILAGEAWRRRIARL